MNRLVRFSTLFAICTLTGLSAMELKASAAPGQTVNSGEVEMKATVNGYCLFENAVDGTLGVDSGALNTLDSTKAANNVTTQDGAAGSIDVTCNDATATINIESVTESNTASMGSPTSSTTTVTGLGSNITSTNGAAGTPVAVSSTVTKTLAVNLQATYPSNLKAGDYTFKVNLVATP